MMAFSVDDTHQEYTLLGGYKFPKGSTAEWITDVFVVGKDGDLIPSNHWSFNIPGYHGVVGVQCEDFDTAATSIHNMLKSKGWI